MQVLSLNMVSKKPFTPRGGEGHWQSFFFWETIFHPPGVVPESTWLSNMVTITNPWDRFLCNQIYPRIILQPVLEPEGPKGFALTKGSMFISALSKSNTLSNMVTKNHRFLCNHIYPKGLGPKRLGPKRLGPKGPWREHLMVTQKSIPGVCDPISPSPLGPMPKGIAFEGVKTGARP